MKKCPKCNLDLPSEAHFCPRCMYEYPRTDSQSKNDKSKNKKKRIIALGFVTILALLSGMLRFWLSENGANQMNKESQEELEQTFRTNETSIENPAIIYDFEDILFFELNSISQILGEEIEEPYLDGEYTIYEFEWAIVQVSQDEKVKSVYIDYLNANENVKEQYGIHGINGKTNESEVLKILGNPDQNYGDEWCYGFAGEIGTPSFRIAFNEEGVVTELQYDTLQ